MRFEPALVTGTLIRRYQRFKADVRMDDGTTVTAHVANTGSMRGCMVPGGRVALSHHPDRGRKLEYSWELSHVDGVWVCVNTWRPNRIVEEALEDGRLGPLRGYPHIRREVRHGERSRMDFFLEGGKGRSWIEVKNVTLARGRTALFPDSVTERGTRHLEELMDIRRRGDRAVILYLVNRPDCTSVSPAAHIDPVYAETLARALDRGVEALAYRTRSDLWAVQIDRKIPVRV